MDKRALTAIGKWYKQFILLMILLLPQCILALGLGNISVHSALYQPFNAEIGLVDAAAINVDNLKVALASPEEFEKLDLDRAYFLTQLQFNILKDINNQPFIKITSSQPISEPYMSFLVNLVWPQGQVTREYTILLDPPVLQTGNTNAGFQAITSNNNNNGGNVLQAQTLLNQSGNNAAPASVATAPLTTSASDQNYFGPITGQENLWYVAQQLQPKSKLSLRDIMITLYRANPDAFQDGNINKLKQGAMLNIPPGIISGTVPSSAPQPAASAPSTPAPVASKPSQSTNSVQQVGEITTQLANALSLQTPTTAAATSTAITPATTATPPASTPASAVSTVKLADTQTNELQSTAVTQNTPVDKEKQMEAELAITTESLNTAKQANDLLKLKLQDLEQKNQQLQQHLDQLTQEIAVLKHTNLPNTQSPTSTFNKPVATQSSAQAAMIQKIIADPMMPMIFVILFIVLMVVLFGFRGKTMHTSTSNSEMNAKLALFLHKNKQPEPKPAAAPENKNIPEKQDSKPSKEDSKPTKESAPTKETKPAKEVKPPKENKMAMMVRDDKDHLPAIKVDGNPIHEAEIYMNYGRYGQAENIILTALKEDKEDIDLWKMLLTIYAESYDQADFEACLADIPPQIILSSNFQSIVENLRKDTWGEAQAPEPTLPINAPQPPAAATTTPPIPEEGLVMNTTSAPATTDQPKPTTADGSEHVVRELDFDLGGGKQPAQPAPPQPQKAEVIAVPDNASLPEDFMDKTSASLHDDEDSILVTETEEDDDLEDVTTIPPEKVSRSETDKAKPTAKTDNAIETNVTKKDGKKDEPEKINSNEFSIEIEPDPVEAVEKNIATPAIDSQIEIDDGSGADKAKEAPKKADEITTAIKKNNPTEIDKEYSESTAENSGATKLDLAQAYIEMGDHQAAKKMLAAVIAEGDAQQKKEAQALLLKLDKK